ncbi:hypothetical protein OL239_08610 [Arthrobacter sp. ATA002]|uniref:hypothetical protein n=1 Tax=Arthrobacter sp. ATA002 TaxID=2991715 RepID=UPI0022A6F381|nr:hypothetical protein [Arthrobacter sp. ATA002]WAP53108.1 hypothetical protein OL239_08610 [Arthrobacter sp. ATA002]
MPKPTQQEPAGETGQLSLLHGFVSPSRNLGTQPAAPELPIARVLLDLAAAASGPGVRLPGAGEPRR